MKHYVLGFVFCKSNGIQHVLLMLKNKPDWMAGRWNGIGGKVEQNESIQSAMCREAWEETGCEFYNFEHRVTFTCPGGTVYVFAATCDHIQYQQLEKEKLEIFEVNLLPDNVMSNLRWLIPLCLANVTTPVMIHANDLGV